MVAKNAKRFLLVAGLSLLLPGIAGAAGFGRAAEPSFWEALSDPAGFLARVWNNLTGIETSGASIDPNGGMNGGAVCTNGDCGASIDPNG
jgi:hypothetical protein